MAAGDAQRAGWVKRRANEAARAEQAALLGVRSTTVRGLLDPRFDSGGDLILRELIATVDDRTTVVCLHAAGQIRRTDEPFDTLAGQFADPPFHIHCRSIVRPWMAGMVDTQRDRANRELMDRPLAQRRIGPGGEIGGVIPPPAGGNPPIGGAPRGPRPAPVAPGGVHPKVPDRFPVSGTRPDLASLGDTTAARTKIDKWIPHASEPVKQWATWVEAGGDLTAIPDELLNDVLRGTDSLGRITLKGNGSGISESYWVHDSKTGEKLILKRTNPGYRGTFIHEPMNEVMYKRLADQYGISSPVARMAGPYANGDGWMLIQNVEDMADWAGWDVAGEVGDFIGAGHSQEFGKEGAHGIFHSLMSNFLANELDAHGGNGAVMRLGNTLRLARFDHSLSFDGRQEAVPGTDSLSGYFLSSRNVPKAEKGWLLDSVESGVISEQDLRSWAEEAATRSGQLDLDALFAIPDGVEATDDLVAYLARSRALLEERRAWLAAFPDNIVRYLSSRY